MDACGYMTRELDECGEPATDDAVACEQSMVADWRERDYDEDLAADAKALYEGCRAGDAGACAYIPSQRVPMAALCAAHDYHACAQLGCVGDDAARATAAAHGPNGRNCDVAGKEALLEWKRDPHHARLPPIAAGAYVPIGARATPPWDAVRFQYHGGRDRADWPRLDIYDLNDHAIVELTVCAYAYDDSGQQLASFTAAHRLDVAPDALVPFSLDGPAEPRLPDGTARIIVDYDRVRFDAGPVSGDPGRCPAQRSASQLGAYMYW